jgi:inhibitor of cysteine peptidase
MKKALPLLFLLCFAAVLLSGCAGLGSGTLPTPTVTVSPSSDPTVAPAEKATVKTDTYTYKSDFITAAIETPVISEISDTAVLDKINKVFTDYAEQAKKSVPDLEKEAKEFAVSSGGHPYELNIGYNVDVNQKGLLCITLSDYNYRGGAHGGELRSSYTFDLKTGQRLQLGDLMVPGSEYKKFINGVIRREIDARVQKGDLAEHATFQDIGDKPDFYLTNTGIVIRFQEYAYFPYAAGIQEFVIPYKDLSGMLRSDLNL